MNKGVTLTKKGRVRNMRSFAMAKENLVSMSNEFLMMQMKSQSLLQLLMSDTLGNLYQKNKKEGNE